MKENYKIEVSEAEEISVINNLSFDFLMPKDRETLGEPFMELSSGGPVVRVTVFQRND